MRTPVLTVGMLTMKAAEFTAGGCGLIVSRLKPGPAKS